MDFFAPQISQEAKRSIPERPTQDGRDHSANELFAETMKETARSEAEITNRSLERNEPERPKTRAPKSKSEELESSRAPEVPPTNPLDEREAEAAAISASLQQTEAIDPKPEFLSSGETSVRSDGIAQSLGARQEAMAKPTSPAAVDHEALARLHAATQSTAATDIDGTSTEIADATRVGSKPSSSSHAASVSAAADQGLGQVKAKAEGTPGTASKPPVTGTGLAQSPDAGQISEHAASAKQASEALGSVGLSASQTPGESENLSPLRDIQSAGDAEPTRSPLSAPTVSNTTGAENAAQDTNSDGDGERRSNPATTIGAIEDGPSGISNEQGLGFQSEFGTRSGSEDSVVGHRAGTIDPAVGSTKTAAAPKPKASETLANRQIEADRIFDQMKVRLAPKRPEVTVRLDPPELGRLHLKLSMQGGEIKASVTTEDARVTRMFENDLSRLVRTLDEAGIRVGAIEIRTDAPATDAESAWSEGWKSSDNQAADQPRDERTPRSQVATQSTPESKTTPKTIRREATSLDLVV